MVGSCVNFFFVPIMPKILDIIAPLNESRPLPLIFVADYKIFDVEEHYFLVFIHSNIGCFCLMLMLVNNDMMFVACTQHACAILAAMGYIKWFFSYICIWWEELSLKWIQANNYNNNSLIIVNENNLQWIKPISDQNCQVLRLITIVQNETNLSKRKLIPTLFFVPNNMKN